MSAYIPAIAMNEAQWMLQNEPTSPMVHAAEIEAYCSGGSTLDLLGAAIADPPGSSGNGGYEGAASFSAATIGMGIGMVSGSPFGVIAGGLGMIGTYSGAASDVSNAFGGFGIGVDASGGVDATIGAATGIGGGY